MNEMINSLELRSSGAITQYNDATIISCENDLIFSSQFLNLQSDIDLTSMNGIVMFNTNTSSLNDITIHGNSIFNYFTTTNIGNLFLSRGKSNEVLGTISGTVKIIESDDDFFLYGSGTIMTFTNIPSFGSAASYNFYPYPALHSGGGNANLTIDLLNGTFTDYRIFHTIESNSNYSTFIFQSTLPIKCFLYLQCNGGLTNEIPMLMISSDNTFTPINAKTDTELNHGDTITCDNTEQSFGIDFMDNSNFYLIPIPTPSNSPTSTTSRSPTPTSTISASPTSSNTPTSTISASPTASNTPTSTVSASSTSSNTPTSTISASPTPTSTVSSSATPTKTNSNTPTSSDTPSSTNSPSPTPTSTISASGTATITNSNTLTSSDTPTRTSTISASPTTTNSNSNTPTSSNSATPTSTISASSTATNTNTPTSSNSPSSTISRSSTPTSTISSSSTSSNTPTSTISASSTATSTSTMSASPSKTNTNTPTPSASPSSTISVSPTPTSTISASPSSTISASSTPSSTISASQTTTNTNTPTSSASSTLTNTISASATPTRTISASQSTTDTNTPTSSSSPSSTISVSPTPTSTISESSTKINTNSNTPTSSNSLSNSPSNVPIISNTPTQTNTATFTPITVAPSLVLLGPSMMVPPSSILNSVTSTTTSSVSAIGTVGTNNLNCFENNCNIKDDITPNSELELITENGEQVGNIFFLDIEGSFDINFATNTNSSLIGNIIVDINIYDLEGNSISKLPDLLKICLKEEKRNDDNICLSFFNTKTEEWECEDECLSREDNQYCGTTDHLTSFALLLTGKTSNSNCSSEDDYVIVWISLAFVGFAIIVFMIVAMVAEFRIRWKRRKLDIFLRNLRTGEEKPAL